jgi:hypothetical protein
MNLSKFFLPICFISSLVAITQNENKIDSVVLVKCALQIQVMDGERYIDKNQFTYIKSYDNIIIRILLKCQNVRHAA